MPLISIALNQRKTASWANWVGMCITVLPGIFFRWGTGAASILAFLGRIVRRKKRVDRALKKKKKN